MFTTKKHILAAFNFGKYVVVNLLKTSVGVSQHLISLQ